MYGYYQYIDCSITAQIQQQYVTYLTGGQQDSTGRNMFGWVEKDGELGDSTGPTSPEETVYVGQTVDPNVVINVNPCFRWSDLSALHTCDVYDLLPWLSMVRGRHHLTH